MWGELGDRLVLAVASSLALALGACSDGRQAGETGGAQVSVSFAAAPADVALVTVTVSGGSPALGTPMVATLAGSGQLYTGAIAGIPAGTGRLFQAVASRLDGTPIYQGQATADVMADATAQVFVLAQEVGGGGTVDVWVPVVDALTASASAVAAGGSVDVAVAAHSPYDPPDALTYLWSATCLPAAGDDGAFTGATSAAATWTAPVLGPSSCVLSVTIGDQHGSEVSAYLIVEVPAGGG